MVCRTVGPHFLETEQVPVYWLAADYPLSEVVLRAGEKLFFDIRLAGLK